MKENKEFVINKYVEYVVAEYKKAGGNEKDVDRTRTYWTLRGIYEREGEQSMLSFIKSWMPIALRRPARGYA